MNIIFDTETTGLLKPATAPVRVQPKIIELFALKFSSEDPEVIVDEIDLLIDPSEPLSDEIVKITGINQDMVDGKPSFATCFPAIQEFWLGSKSTSGHNVTFDIQMLEVEARRLGAVTKFPWSPRQICTVESSLRLNGGKRMKLQALYEHLFNDTFESAHRARNDVIATHRCFLELVRRNLINLP